jgi:hypothetical protein
VLGSDKLAVKLSRRDVDGELLLEDGLTDKENSFTLFPFGVRKVALKDCGFRRCLFIICDETEPNPALQCLGYIARLNWLLEQ